MRWVTALEGPSDMVATTPTAGDWARQVEGAVAFGRPLLLARCGEELDPLLEHLLGKSYTRCAARATARRGWRR